MTPPRFFNTAGPMKADMHYVLDPLARIDLPLVMDLAEQAKFWILHAPRQTGKTTCLLALRDHLNERGYRCVYVNVEVGQAYREDIDLAQRHILQALEGAVEIQLAGTELAANWRAVTRWQEPGADLGSVLRRWASASDRPVVLFIDEIDSLVGDTLIAVLRQLRAGYPDRPAHFPQSVVLCGVRDVRDYRMHVDAGKPPVAGGSAFNIAAEALRLGNFGEPETRALLDLHTAETGQVFTPDARAAIWTLTNGQPWLVNALAYETCFRMRENQDRTRTITLPMVEAAKEALILRRVTHLDQLVAKLEEPRVRRVIQPILVGEEDDAASTEDLQYVVDLGLVETASGRPPRIANPIYREVLPRELSQAFQNGIAQEQAWYLRPDGSLDLAALLDAFEAWFRENADAWIARFDYREAGPHLLLMAFLQRVVNGGGRIHREYALGRRRVDLRVDWPAPVPRTTVIELKVIHRDPERTLAEGLAQTAGYMALSAADEGHLLLFDRTPDKRWAGRITRHQASHDGQTIEVWGL